MPIQHHRTCSICEANCGILVTAEGRDILSIKGDPDNALSRGHICPNSPPHTQLHTDSDRFRKSWQRN